MHKCYEFYKLLHNDCNKFPKSERHTLGETIKSRILILIDGFWKANDLPLPERLAFLNELQRTLDLVKLLIRLVHDCGIYKIEGYIYRQERLHAIGNMLGVWRKNSRKKIGLDP